MTLVHCRGCLFWYDSRYLYRHHNNSPQCLVISQQGQEVESEQEPMMEAGEDDSESGSMVLERLLAESSEDDEHMERPTSKRDRPNSDDEYCVYNNSGLGSDESLSKEASHSSTPDDARDTVDDVNRDYAQEKVELELGTNWDAFDFLDAFSDDEEEDDDDNSMEEIELDVQGENCWKQNKQK
jgi:hypothetical protein